MERRNLNKPHLKLRTRLTLREIASPLTARSPGRGIECNQSAALATSKGTTASRACRNVLGTRGHLGLGIAVLANPRARPGWVRLASPRVALAFAIFYLLLLAAMVPLAIMARQVSANSLFLLLFLPFAAVGFLIASRQPRNPIGWIMLLLALAFTVSADAGFYAVAAFRVGRHGLPLARVAVVLATGWIGLILLPLPIVLFPDGRAPSQRWRWTVRLYVVLAATFVAVIGFEDIGAFTDRHIHVDSSGELAQFSSSGSGLTSIVSFGLFLTFTLLSLSWVIQRMVDYRRSTGERRQQLKWLMSGGAISIIGVVASVALSNSHSALLGALSNVATAAIVTLPISIGVGILKYRLYEIDRLISRTVSYAALTGILVGVFVGMVSLTTDVLPFSSPLAVAASTLVAAVMFNPLRQRLQRLVDRRFNRARYDADATVAIFTQCLRDATGIETVQHELLAVVDGAVQPAHASLWLRPPLQTR